MQLNPSASHRGADVCVCVGGVVLKYADAYLCLVVKYSYMSIVFILMNVSKQITAVSRVEQIHNSASGIQMQNDIFHASLI